MAAAAEISWCVHRTLEAIMVGRLGAARLGALSIGGSVVSVSFPLFNFFSYATTPMVARALATNDTKEASRSVSPSFFLTRSDPQKRESQRFLWCLRQAREKCVAYFDFADCGRYSYRLVAQGIWLSTVVGCSLMAVMLIFCDGILLTMGANAEVHSTHTNSHL